MFSGKKNARRSAAGAEKAHELAIDGAKERALDGVFANADQPANEPAALFRELDQNRVRGNAECARAEEVRKALCESTRERKRDVTLRARKRERRRRERSDARVTQPAAVLTGLLEEDQDVSLVDAHGSLGKGEVP